MYHSDISSEPFDVYTASPLLFYILFTLRLRFLRSEERIYSSPYDDF
jgi:hypothetical protein